jgi:hypothetical protein
MKMKTVVFGLAIILLNGCVHLVEPDRIPPSPPTGLATSTGDNFVELFWNRNPERDIAGYNVFASDRYDGRYELIGSSRDPYFNDTGARNGNTYYYAVTAYDFDGNESDLSRDVAYDVPRPEGYDVVLTNYRQNSAHAGYDFSTYRVVAFDAQNTDMFFEDYNGEYYMNVYTDTDIQDLGYTHSLLDVKVAPAGGWSSTHDARLFLGHTYVVWTHDDHYAKFRVTKLSPDRVVFDWAYQLQTSNPMLKRPSGVNEENRQKGIANTRP